MVEISDVTAAQALETLGLLQATGRRDAICFVLRVSISFVVGRVISKFTVVRDDGSWLIGDFF